jgi:YggT family protein
MLDPFVTLVSNILQLYSWCIIIWAILEVLVSFKVVNPFQPAVQKIRYALNRLTEPALRPIRKFLPDLGGIDISPIILLLLISFTQDALHKYFYGL